MKQSANGEQQVFAAHCEIVDETIAMHRHNDKPLPPPTADQGIAERVA